MRSCSATHKGGKNGFTLQVINREFQKENIVYALFPHQTIWGKRFCIEIQGFLLGPSTKKLGATMIGM
ncbi:MAG: hypothetical protein CK532_05105 [Flavobacteriales bacterium]|nr:MAG: hypothetical protein CK532_05105 [Flavobacteriales bacterium]